MSCLLFVCYDSNLNLRAQLHAVQRKVKDLQNEAGGGDKSLTVFGPKVRVFLRRPIHISRSYTSHLFFSFDQILPT